MSPPSKSKSPSGPFFRYLMLGLIVWGAFVAIGAFLGPEVWTSPTGQTTTESAPAPGSLTRRFDVRKPLIVVGVVGAFVGGWGLLMLSRQKRLARQSAEREEQLAAAKARS